MEVVSQRRPTEAEWSELLFAWRVCKHVRSNAIVLTRELATIGIGAGQMSRVDSVRLAIEKAQSELNGSALASDAYFPFPDGPQLALDAGVTAIIQPGGSVRDPHGRGRRRRRRGDGIHRPPALPALSPVDGSAATRRRRSRVATASAVSCAPGRSCSSAARRRSIQDGVVLGGGPYEQTIEILRKIEHELGRMGASLADVVSTRIYVTDISRGEEVGRAHGEVFGEHPAADAPWSR